MAFAWIIFGILQAVSVCFALATLWRLYYYIRRYRFDESKYTLLFGFVHLHWIAISYLACLLVWFFASYFIFTIV